MKLSIRTLICGLLFIISSFAQAFTAIASIDNQVKNSFWSAYNFQTQKEANSSALNGCRTEAKKNGIGKIARQCKITMIAKGPGYGALTCGDDGCGFVTGYDSSQGAADAVYASCIESYKNCADKEITYWEDTAGFNGKRTPKVDNNNSCRPNTPTIRCSSSCTNGNCVVSYENGCKMRVQINPKFNPFNNQWEYPSPSC